VSEVFAARDTDALITEVLAGDTRATNRFFVEHSRRVYKFVLPRVGGDQGAAEDLCQLVMSRAMRRLYTYRGEAKLSTWLCQIARNELSRYWERRRARDAHVVDVLATDDERRLTEMTGADEERPEAQRLRSEISALMRAALKRLPHRYATVLFLRYFEDAPIKEIAARLGDSSLAIQSLLVRARLALRAEIESTGVSSMSDAFALVMP
jgi:RNA polymerase sigma-70 factor (ECF subfamily)